VTAENFGVLSAGSDPDKDFAGISVFFGQTGKGFGRPRSGDMAVKKGLAYTLVGCRRLHPMEVPTKPFYWSRSPVTRP
jgi:hypothetical protein